MTKKHLLNSLKIALIVCLLIAITIVAVLRWKSDLILEQVMASLQHQLTDSLQYEESGMDWFSHFPSTSIHIKNLKLGSGKQPLIDGGDIAIVMPLLPLLKNKIVIHRLQVQEATIHIIHHLDKWSYEILKESETSNESSFTTLVRELVIENATLTYRDGKNFAFALSIFQGNITGSFEEKFLETEITLNSALTDLTTEDYRLPESIAFELKGEYSHDLISGLQGFKDWHILHDAIELKGEGTILKTSGHEEVDLDLSWKKGRPELLKKWIPEKSLKDWDHFTITGESEGHAKIKGVSSKKETPHITCTAIMENGTLDFLSQGEKVTGLHIKMKYDNGASPAHSKSELILEFRKGALRGPSLEGRIKVANFQKPALDVNFKGTLPASLLNLVASPSIVFEKGNFVVKDFVLHDFKTSTPTFMHFLQKNQSSFTAKDVRFSYLGNTLLLSDGDLKIEKEALKINLDRFTWNKASASDFKGSLDIKEGQLAFNVSGALCNGKAEAQGHVTDMDTRPTLSMHGKVKGIEMKELFASFSDFDQTFITSENLKGKADIWAEITLPFDAKWNILPKSVRVKSAMDIRDGQLKGMKTLEDFSKYIHLDDLRDIRFSQLRNYMKIEDGKVYLPVMFIQSSAVNLSISGVHGFDHKILYNVKLNAGQTAAHKLKKSDVTKDLKRARKSGWINMYFVLEGTVSDVRYQQYRTAVISGFEQSAALKESLRNHLVERFGYDVYWLEPNEWEDIPEYK